MKRLLLLLLLIAPAALAQTYNVPFTATENPISQGGHWVNGLATGVDWGNVQTVSGSQAAYGTTISGGPPYNDSIAVLTGTWGPDQTVTGTVVGCSGANIGVFKEISIFLRFSITAHTAKGLGADWSCENANNGQPYHEFGSWCGPINAFAGTAGCPSPPAPTFHVGNGPGNGVVNGDVISVSLIGNVVTMKKNGVVQVQSGVGGAPFDNFDTVAGAPGIGFYLQSGTATATSAMLTDHGLANVTLTATGGNSNIIAASCSANDVATALSKVTSDGIIVSIPACPAGVTWGAQTAFNPGGNGNASVDANGQLTYNLGFSTEIKGQGNLSGSLDSLGNTICWNGSAFITCYNDQTVITDNVLTGSAIHITWSTNGKYLRISGMTFNGGAGGPQSPAISPFGFHAQNVNCTWPTGSDGGLTAPVVGPCLRLDHNHFGTGLLKQVVVSGWLYGVADHNIWDMNASGGSPNGIQFWDDGYANDPNSQGDGSWNDVENYGTGSFMFAENNTFNNRTPTGAVTFNNDCFAAGRFVVRNNTVNGHSEWQSHRDVSSARGCRAWEIYGNIANAFSDAGGGGGGQFDTYSVMRMGDGMVWGNTISNYGTTVRLLLDRSGLTGQTTGQPPADYGYCGNNSTTQGLGQTQSSGWDGNAAGTGSGTNGYPCFDQNGRGKGDLLSGQFPSRCNQTQGCATFLGVWPRQAVSPVYTWGNTLTNVANYVVSAFNNAQIVDNRDYFQQLPNVNNSATFNGTAGIGCGAGGSAGSPTATCANPVARPATCTAGTGGTLYNTAGVPGVAYWNDESATPAKTLFVCSATNTWTSYYSPYTYPHPLVVQTGGAPLVSFSPTSLSFGSVIVGQTSPVQIITLQNTGNAILTISGISLTGTNPGDYSQANTCGTAVNAGGSCQISVTFAPTTTGIRTANVSVSDNAAGNPQTVPLSGTGTTATANFAVAPTSLTYASQTVGTSSAPQTLTVTNSGSAALTITSILSQGTNAGDFVPTPTGCASVAPSGGTCTVSVVFTPAAAGNRSSAIVFVDNASTSPQSVPVTGVGAGVAGISFNPVSIAFPNTRVLLTSTALSTTVTNTGGATLTISSVGLTGANASMFSISANTCTTSLAPNATCNTSVTFTPSSTGSKTAALSFTDNAAGSPQNVPISGTGTQSDTNFVPTSLSFGSQQVSTTSAPLSTRLTNTGSATLNITSIVITGTNPSDFLIASDTCGSSLAPVAFCDIGVTFTPQATGSRTANLSFTDDAPGSPQTVPLSGTGTSPQVGFSPLSLAFGSVSLVSSAGQSVTLTNTGGAPLIVSNITITGSNPSSFSQTNNCTTVAPSATCTINATFTPQAVGALSALISVTDNATGSPHTVPMTGTGAQGVASFSPGSLPFGNVTVGTTSAALSTTLTNTGTASFNITSIVLGGATPALFSITGNTCGASLAPSASCVVSVKFSPVTVGAITALLVFTDTAPGSPQSVGLSGTGTGVPAVSFNPTSLTFPSTFVGQSSAPQVITLQNSGSAPLTITSISLTGTNPGDYLEVNTCGSSVAVGGSCTITVTFNPTASGSRTANVQVADNAAGSPHTVPLTGTATTATASFSVLPTSLTFASQTVGTSSAPQTLTVTNSGSAALTITSIVSQGTNSADFVPTPTGCASVAPSGGTCTVSVVFTPSTTGARSSAIVFTDNASGSPHSVPVSGTGTAAAVSFNPASLTFPSTPVGTTSAALTTTLQNTGGGTLTISSITITGTNAGDFAETNTCGSSVVPGGSCVITVKFTPTANGSRVASVSVADNAVGSPHTVSLQGPGFTPSPTVSLSIASIAFGNQTVGTQSNAQVVILTNTGTASLTISSTSITGTNAGDFGSSTTCGGTLAAGAACSYSFIFTPTAAGARSATFNLNTNAASSPDHVALAGTGVSSPNGGPAPQLFGF